MIQKSLKKKALYFFKYKAFFLSIVLFASSVANASPQVYLTLPDDPARQMSIHWIAEVKSGSNSVFIQKKGEDSWNQVSTMSSQQLVHSQLFVSQCVVKGLEPATSYSFRLDEEEKVYHFRTLPSDLSTPLKVIVGGDMMEDRSLYRKMNLVAASKEADFAVLGGDIAYACGKGILYKGHGSTKQWVAFFAEWEKNFVDKTGYLMPIVATLGNHDVTSTDTKEKGANAHFLKLFPSSQNKTYKTFDMTEDLSFVLLDSDHIARVDGEQTVWLEKTLKERVNTKWKIPVYHRAGYPSVYLAGSKHAIRVRDYWVPLFEKYGVRLALEHHNHAFKRTYPLLKGEINLSGVVYIGDGCWGVHPRKKVESPNYIAQYKQSNCLCLLTVTKTSLTVDVFNEKDEKIDSWQAD